MEGLAWDAAFSAACLAADCAAPGSGSALECMKAAYTLSSRRSSKEDKAEAFLEGISAYFSD